jgi:hypothetical protein
MWPHTSVRPEGAGLPHGLPRPEPDRPRQRPITPFRPDRLPPHPATPRPQSPTWAEDRNGWHATAVPSRHLVDEAALPPWPSLFDDDGDEEDEPDWTALQRGFERMLRLDGEQRRR